MLQVRWSVTNVHEVLPSLPAPPYGSRPGSPRHSLMSCTPVFSMIKCSTTCHSPTPGRTLRGDRRGESPPLPSGPRRPPCTCPSLGHGPFRFLPSRCFEQMPPYVVWIPYVVVDHDVDAGQTPESVQRCAIHPHLPWNFQTF